MHSVYLTLMKYGGCFNKKILMCYPALVLLRIDLFSSTEMCDSLFRNNENKSLWLTQIFLYRFHRASIPELRIRLASVWC